MNKNDLIKEVASCAGVTRSLASRCIDCYHSAIQGGLRKREKVTMMGFGTFSVSARKARSGRNPQTGKMIRIEARDVVKFKPGFRLRQAVK